jgi:hypothetical protein
MDPIVRIMLAADLVVSCLQQAVPTLYLLGPMGGSHFAQIGIFLILGYAVAELKLICREMKSQPSKMEDKHK